MRACTANDEFGNDRNRGEDRWHVRGVPFPIWNVMEPASTTRLSRDCLACADTLRGSVVDDGDGSYVATMSGFKKGAYKVLSELALPGGAFATYYTLAADEHVMTSAFHRGGLGVTPGGGGQQIMDSVLDFAMPCVYRKRWAGVPEGTYQCSSWIRGRAQGGDLTQVCRQLMSITPAGSLV